jgi:hypothetical protein
VTEFAIQLHLRDVARLNDNDIIEAHPTTNTDCRAPRSLIAR